MNLQDYTEATRSTYGNDPTENTQEAVLCINCQLDLTNEEIQEEQQYCFDCLDIIDENTNFRNL
tara:strand:+ start:267 stop:458 length:192 start_codon:yes stop_codon:yes gene_type:complete